MRAVIDTSILVRALIKPQSTVAPVLHHLRAGTFTLLYTEPLLAELVEVLNRPRLRDKYAVDREAVEALLKLVLLRGESIVVSRSILACRDPKDDMVLEAAAEGKADMIVTGDEDLLVLDPFEGIRIGGPREFLGLLEPR